MAQRPFPIDSLRTMLREMGLDKQAAPAGVGETTHQVMQADDGTEAPREGARAAENEEDVKETVGPDSVNSAPDASPGATNATLVGMGETKHPVMDADDGTEAAQEGARARENEEDVKETVGPDSVESQPDLEGKGAAARALQLGTRKSGVGDDPATEKNYGPAAPAIEGPKYAEMPLSQLMALSAKQANALLAGIVVEARQAPSAPPAPDKAAAAARAGYATAAAAGGGDAMVENTIHEACKAAALVADYLPAFYAELAKQADPADGDGDGGGAPPAPEGPPPPGPTGQPDMAALLAGAGAGGGAMPGGPGPEAGGPGGASSDEILHEILSACQELGISPEELPQLLAQAGDATPGGGPTPPPAEAAGAPKEAAVSGVKLAAQLKAYRRSGKYAFDRPASQKAARLRGEMRDYLIELLAKSGR